MSSSGREALSERGGIVARGILVDFVRYAERRGITYDPLGSYAISLDQIKDIIAEQNLEVRQGDILIIRSGLSKYVHAHLKTEHLPIAEHTSVLMLLRSYSSGSGITTWLQLLGMLWLLRLYLRLMAAVRIHLALSIVC